MNDEPPAISIIITTYNSREDIEPLIESLRQQTMGDYELIVVDSASDDGTVELLRAQYPDVRILETGRNVGYGVGNNRGAAIARGKHLVFLNPDTVVDGTWLERLVDAAEANGPGLYTSAVLLMSDRERVNTCGIHMHLAGFSFCEGLGGAADTRGGVTDVRGVSGCAFLIPRELFDRLGGFDELVFLYHDDVEYSWRAALAGIPRRLVPDSVVWHDFTLRVPAWKFYYLERNRHYLLLKFLGLPSFVLLLSSLVAAEVIVWGYVLLTGPSYVREKLRAYWWVVRNLGDIARARASIAPLREVDDLTLLSGLAWCVPFEQLVSGPGARRALDLAFNPLFRLNAALVRWLAGHFTRRQ